MSIAVIGLVEIAGICGGYAVLRGYAEWVERTSRGPGAIRRALSVGLPVVGVATAVALHHVGLDALVRSFVPVGGSFAAILVLSAVHAVAGVAAVSAGGYLAAMVGYAATLSVTARLQGGDADAGRRERIVQFGLFAASVVVVIDLTVTAVATGSIVFATGTILLLAVGFYVTAGYAVTAMSRLRSATPRDRDLVRRVDPTGVVNAVHVLDTTDSGWAGAFVRGPPTKRTLFVASRLLDAYARDEAAVVLAAAVGRAHRGYFATKVAGTALLGIGLAAVVTGHPVIAVGGIVAYLGCCWVARRSLFAADEDALAHVQYATVAATYRRVADDADTALDAGGPLRNGLRGRASRARRLSHLEQVIERKAYLAAEH